MKPLLAVAAAVLLINVPFGYWRAGVRKFGFAWFLAVHGAVPLVAVLRWSAGVPWRLSTFPVLVAAYFSGQLVGARIRRRSLPD